MHVAGGAEHAADPGVYHDTHTDPVPPAVLALLERLRERLDVAPAVMLERDGRYPPAATLRAELDAIAAAAALPSATLAGRSHAPRRRRMTRELRGACPRVARSGTASPAFRDTTSASVHARPDPTADLAARQAELVAALVAGAPDPAGFDPDRLAVARRALLRKRAGEVAAVWPLLAASLGPRLARHRSPLTSTGRAPAGALRDGWDLARELGRRGELSDAAAVELAEREVTLHHDGATAAAAGRSPVRRTGPSCRSAAGCTTSCVR